MAAQQQTVALEPIQASPRLIEKSLVSWNAPSRPFKKHNKDFYVKLMAIASVIGLILFIVEGFMPVILLVALVFLYYVMSTIEPESLEYQITNFGIKMGLSRTEWNMLGRFWFTSRFGTELLVVESANFAGRMEFVLDPTKKEEVRKAVEEYLPYEQIPQATYDRAANWISKNILGY